MQAADVPPENNATLSKFQAENAALRLALYETVKKDMAVKVGMKLLAGYSLYWGRNCVEFIVESWIRSTKLTSYLHLKASVGNGMPYY